MQATENKKKLIFLSCSCFFISAAYSILRPLKISLFFHIVGREYYPISKFFLALLVIPYVAIYSNLVDKYKKQNLIYIIFSFYSILCLIFSYLLSHPVMGISNTTPSPYRILGWIFTVTMDLYPTFVMGTMWAFINSISTPEFAKKSYGPIYAVIKVGNILATIASFFLTQYNIVSKEIAIPLLVFVGSVLTISSSLFVRNTIKKVDPKYLEGYKVEKEPKKNKSSVGILSGLKTIIKKPYVFGIFLLFYFYDVVFAIFEYQATMMLSMRVSNCAQDMSPILFLSAFLSQLTGLIMAAFAVPKILKKMKLRYSLMIMPITVVFIVAITTLKPNLITMIGTISVLPAIHYGVNSPIRELLFIPTVKDIQFKSKAWIDSFGRTLSKSSGSTVNMLFHRSCMETFLLFNSIFSSVLVSLWIVTAYLTGKKYQKTIDQKEIIG